MHGLQAVWVQHNTLIWGGGVGSAIACHIADLDLNGSFILTSEAGFYSAFYDSSAGHW